MAIWVMLLILTLWVAAYPLAKYLPSDIFNEPFGSIYNGLNVLFTALAFGGVIISLRFQAEESKVARREEIERSIFELFQTFTTQEFQHIKDSSFRVLLAAVKNRDYAEYVASRLFVVGQKALPQDKACLDLLRSLDAAKQNLNDEEIVHADRADRLMLDNMLNFFAMLAQRKSSSTVIKHCDFAYDWWRPVLWIIAQLQQDLYNSSPTIRDYCRNQLVIVTLNEMDKIYGHPPLGSRNDVWEYITRHPKLTDFQIDPRFKGLLEPSPA